ncbi:proline-rich spliceosome-associated family protein [Tribonema minus]|uniref:Proline-rich spliceosome-associated family protein n=1 Tax=Tribonema minus TaxID=303371 RepID=A0A836CFT2_9STRA|nr:proline-rich spliceosome-associated family protein [Tribonema minus]
MVAVAQEPALNGNGHRKLTKNEKRRQRKKQQPKSEQQQQAEAPQQLDGEGALAVEVEYVAPSASDLVEGSGMDDEVAKEFKEIFERFSKIGRAEEDIAAEEEDAAAAAAAEAAGGAAEQQAAEDGGEEGEGEEGGGAGKLSRKARKLKSRLTVAELKQLVQRPDVVEAHDVTAADPRMLVHLKSYRNTVPVPRHWCHKRKYLQGKRGIEKKPFELPEFIAMTGISKLRDNVDEADGKRAKQRSRERVQPKMGKIDIDYQVLHDAFFKWQTKPHMTSVGDLYFEGKEFEVRLREKKPGQLSEELRAALGMPDGAPPPWLINMQRYGPPPSYPHLRIPGLSAPIPPGASFGYHPGGWGKPPVNEAGVPLYGDVFGTMGVEEEAAAIDRSHWGEMAEEESSEEEEEEEEEAAEGGAGALTEAPPTPMEGTESSMTGLETPDALLDLRKRGLETPSDIGTPAPRELYTVVGETSAGVGGALFGADKRYAVGGAAGAGGKKGGKGGEGAADVAVSINPDEIEAQLEDAEALRERYEASLQAARPEREDVSDIVAEEARKRKRKLEKGKERAAAKKSKDFKF